MTESMPMFPLNTVLFPGISVPLYVFEDRYRALVHRMLAIQDPAERIFGSVAIREGYEVGDHGGQSVHRVGCYLQLTEVREHPDGAFDIEAVGRGRIRLDAMDTTGPFLAGTVTRIEEPQGAEGEEEQAFHTRSAFLSYREALSRLRGSEVLDGNIPRDPTYLSWSLSATCLLTLRERQSLLEATDTPVRLAMLREMLREEMRAMRAIPSLPATEVARTRWSPN